MAHSRSSEKRIRQNERRRIRAKAERSKLRTQLKKFSKALEEGSVQKAQAEFKVAASLLDKASKHKTIHDNHAARRKSRMQQKLNKLVAGGGKAATSAPK